MRTHGILITTMNDFLGKKSGEVGAFALVGKETFEKGVNALRLTFGDETYKELLAGFENQYAALEAAVPLEAKEPFNAKIKATGEKLRAMRDMYLADRWDDAAEHLEWAGFFEGAAIVHWELVRAGAVKNNISALAAVAEEAIAFHRNLFELGNGAIRGIGEARA